MSVIEAYPLCWPVGKPRCKSRGFSAFKTTFAKARDKCRNEIYLLSGDEVIISTNIPLKGNGDPYADHRKNINNDTGVAVYFTYKKKQMAFCCDRWWKVEDNMHAISLTIGALRGIARWGTGDMMEAAFTGFTALTSPDAARPWRETLGNDIYSDEQLEARYRALRSQHHPDKGGTPEMFDRVQKAYEQARQEIA